MASKKFSYLTEGNIVELHPSYRTNKRLQSHLFDIGVVRGKTETGFVIIQDVHGHDNLLKISELVKLTNEDDTFDEE